MYCEALRTVRSARCRVVRQLVVLLSGRTAPPATCVDLDINENQFPLHAALMEGSLAAALERQRRHW